jgi:hypothetical protein
MLRHEGAVKPSSIENEEHVTVGGVGVKRVLMSGYKSGVLNDALVMNDGELRTISQDYLYSVAEGDITGHTPFTKYGRCTVSNATMDVWESNSVYAFPSSATKLDVVSSDTTNDKDGATGANKVKINGLNSLYAEITEEVTLAATAVTTTNSFLRINKMWISAAGANGVAAGTITAKLTTAATVYAQISIGLTQSRQLIYTVPANKCLYITSITFSAGVGNTAASGKFNYVTFTIRAKVDPDTGLASTIFYPFNEVGLVNQSFYRPLEIPTKICSTADLKISVIGDTAQAVGCNAAIRGWIE